MELTGIVADIKERKIEYQGETPRSTSKFIDGVLLTIYAGKTDGFKEVRFPRTLSEAEKNIMGSRRISYSEKIVPFSGDGLHISTFYYKIEILEGVNKGKTLEAELSKG